MLNQSKQPAQWTCWQCVSLIYSHAWASMAVLWMKPIPAYTWLFTSSIFGNHINILQLGHQIQHFYLLVHPKSLFEIFCLILTFQMCWFESKPLSSPRYRPPYSINHSYFFSKRVLSFSSSQQNCVYFIAHTLHIYLHGLFQRKKLCYLTDTDADFNPVIVSRIS